ncbi:MAG: hypothetical protein N2255_09580 [Kiritimatiellae bacterium]|nr:hypothetical protein [Kiritimatiellia bacterium]
MVRAARYSPFLIILVVIGLWAEWRSLSRDNFPADVPVKSPPLAWPEMQPPSNNWSVFHARTPQTAPSEGALSARFRLVGTYFESSDAGSDVRRAVLDDLQHGTQRIVSENDLLDDVLVVRIYRDHVVLRKEQREEELWLGFASGSQASASGIGEAGTTAEEEIMTDRFGGRRVAENQWIFRRDRLLEYYKQLMDEPRRLLAVFDSMKPVYDENRKITGYQLEMVGEKDFYEAVGLRNGDIVRKVNSLPMTNRRRAEYFISEFVNDRANAFVLEVERDGQIQKLIYQIR